jgi:surface polysaccharide O-acyltransferase-like enzyme
LKRIESVETFRLFAIFAVISIHTTPSVFPIEFIDWKSAEIYSIPALITQLARFAVPYFFIVSGYFWGLKITSGTDVLQLSMSMVKRLAFVFLAWSFVYILPYNYTAVFEYGLLGPLKLAYWKIVSLSKDPVDVLLQGTKVHLWFLEALVCCLLIAAGFVAKKNVRGLMATSVAFYVLGVLGGAYIRTPLGIDLRCGTRNGPFFGLIFFSTGYLLSTIRPNSGWLSKGAVVITFGYAMHFSELYFLNKYFNTSWNQGYVFGTYFVGLGCAMIALSNPHCLRFPHVSIAGRMTLGIYAIHFIFVDNLYLIDRSASLMSHVLWEVWYLFAVVTLSAASVFLLAKIKFVRRFMI